MTAKFTDKSFSKKFHNVVRLFLIDQLKPEVSSLAAETPC